MADADWLKSCEQQNQAHECMREHKQAVDVAHICLTFYSA